MRGKEKDNTICILVIDSVIDDAVDIEGERIDWNLQWDLYTATAGTWYVRCVAIRVLMSTMYMVIGCAS